MFTSYFQRMKFWNTNINTYAAFDEVRVVLRIRNLRSKKLLKRKIINLQTYD
jgi:hypothetical protein